MDDKLMREIILNADFNKLMNSVKTPEDIGASKRILEYFEKKGYDVKKYKQINERREKAMISGEMN
jgi:hypothetical protein